MKTDTNPKSGGGRTRKSDFWIAGSITRGPVGRKKVKEEACDPKKKLVMNSEVGRLSISSHCSGVK